MPAEKSFFGTLLAFSFAEFITTRFIRFLYGLAIALGAIAALYVVFEGLRSSPAEGVLALVLAAIGLFLWVLCVRVVLEIMIVVFRIAEHTAVMARSVSQQ